MSASAGMFFSLVSLQWISESCRGSPSSQALPVALTVFCQQDLRVVEGKNLTMDIIAVYVGLVFSAYIMCSFKLCNVKYA